MTSDSPSQEPHSLESAPEQPGRNGHDRFVFHDPSGKRARRAGQFGGLLLSLLAAIVAGFLATLAFAPRLPTIEMQDPRVLQGLHQETAKRFLKGAKPAWTRIIQRPRAAATNKAIRPLTVGFYVSWDAEARQSLKDHASQLDVVAPQWIALHDAQGDVDLTDDAEAMSAIAAQQKPPAIMAVVHNAHEAIFDTAIGDGIILNKGAEDKLLATLVVQAAKHNYAGYCFDLENLSPNAIAAYPAFLRRAKAALAPHKLEVWVTAPFDDEDQPFRALQDATDSLVLMAYDQHWSTGSPGPAAGQDWFEKNLDLRMSKLDPEKTIMAYGSYGYDWAARDASGQGRADVIDFHEAMQIARDSSATIRYDDDALNPTFSYTDEDNGGIKHTVWFLDATTLFNQVKVTDPWRVRGYAMWRLGAEDPGMWSILGKPYGQVDSSNLTRISTGQGVDFDGTGEVLHITATPTLGHRSLTFDPDTGLIADQSYDKLPSAYEIQRYGAKKGLVALTFDDGPDPRWTPKILQILKDKDAPATFFVIGMNMQKHPELVEREVRQGMVVGNHTYTHPNIGLLPVPETDLELNATQRLFEVITGRSMRFMRPPYFGDAEPSTPAEVDPLVDAQKLGYLIAGLRIDPDDWKKPDPALIVQRSLAQLADPGTIDRPPGQVILLHDSGGDRSRTIEALPNLIDQLRAHGYRLVSLAELAGMPVEQGNPPTQRQWLELTLDRLGFGIFREVNFALEALFITAITLGMLRLVFLAVLALVHRFREGGREPKELDPETGPLVSVLIPCFNEEKVIAASVARILESRWTRLEVLVLDDGSSDGTSAEVEKHFASDPRVRLMRFPNGGKALALNRGLDQVKGEIVVALDADTLFPPSTIPRLVRWFADPKVGAVAGNALVGNRRNIVTRWQALEYVTAQNLERRALAALGAVTVVPGAVGAWRRAALEQLGGYPADTLAEDQDLTIAVQRAGWRVEFDPDARAYTEAPETVQGLLKQRFRWSFGTLQCIWKHREATFSRKRPILGFVALPQIWLFQIVLATAAPLVDLAVVWSLIAAGLDHVFHQAEAETDSLVRSLLYWAVFIFVDLSAAALGMALEKRAPWRELPWLPVQRFGYRQLMYYVVLKAVITAVRGPIVGWGKLERRATAAVESHT
ncbi:glycosyltransferase [Phenylobacterium montanum]|uniref:Chitooligosaccharide deacetylase n=1 Tax=Phenylobacterium montanum TaxID=2823693 RepID=A0A975FWX6_9CAUL|nr:glycosyltransferase [Caulobacter sp. S6]QUD86800.1 glycosyltransferase [Caulobacter sp. S6]